MKRRINKKKEGEENGCEKRGKKMKKVKVIKQVHEKKLQFF
jgi:hypothetical protein